MSKIFQRQFSALNKKNWLIYKRNLCVVLGELLLPLVMMMFIVSIRKVSKPIYNKQQSYELDGFYADNNYVDSTYMFKNSEFDCMQTQAIGIIGDDSDGILDETLDSFYKNSRSRFNGSKPYKTIHFDTVKDFNNYIRQYKDVAVSPNITQLCFGVGIVREDKTYTLSIFSNMIPSSNSAPFEQGDNIPKYYGGFQDIRSSHLPTFMVKVSEIISKHQEPNKEHDFKLAFVPRKTEEYHSDIFSAAMHQTFPPLVVVIFLIPFMNFFQKALEEKVHKIREYMRMMGMKDSAYTASWVVYYVLQIFVICIELAVITRIYLTPNSNIILVFLFYFMYGLSLFGWIVGLVALFNNVKTGSAAAIIIHFATYYIVHAIPKAATYSTRCFASLFPNLAMNQGSEIMWKLEEQGIGLSFSTIGMTFKNYNFMTYFMMCTINFFLAILIGTYLSYVLPTEYGIRRHPCFCLMPSFWSRKRRGTNSRIISIDLKRNTPVKEFSYLKLKEEQKLNNFDNDLEMVSQDFNNFEPVSVHIQNKEKLELKSLVKVYDNGVKAVDNLSLTMYKDQIFALLGPNGAGKTSTISMITGLYEATQGSAHIYDINIFEEMDQVREILGVCPQHNVLYDQLTAEEHFEIFCEFKGVDAHLRKSEINNMLGEVDLKEQKDLLSKNLSGGQKRRVNIGIALLGGSKIVLLDEPSSGLDPKSRRHLWDMLKRHKRDRIMILTTHFMEEADILGDRIAIITKGRASCCGSSLFLKKKFGVGYNLTIDKTSKEKSPQIDAFILARIQNARKLSEVSSEMTYQLPNDSVKKFKEFFDTLDNRKVELGVKSYGIGVTTLEEVFLKVCEGKILGENDDNLTDDEKINNFNYDRNSRIDDYCLIDGAITGFELIRLQIYAMIIMRIKLIFRQCRPLIFEVFYPSLLIILGAIIMYLSTKSGTTVTDVSINDFPMKQEFSYSEDPSIQIETSRSVVNSFFNNSMFTAIHQDVDHDEDFRVQFEKYDDILFKNRKRDQTFGSAYFRSIEKKADKNAYNVVNVLDISSGSVLSYFTAFMCNALIRDSTGDPEITLNLSYGSFPRSQVVDDWLQTTMAIMTVISFSLAVGNITSAIAANIIMERNESIRHQQIVSGGSLFAYWMSHYFVDILKFITPAVCFIAIYAIDVDIGNCWLLLILLVISVLPFTYCISFVFSKDSTARTSISYLHFIMGGFMSLIIFGLQFFKSGEIYAKVLKWILRLQPGFAFCNGIVQLILKNMIPIEYVTGGGIYSLDKVGGDILMLCISPVLYIVILYIIELNIFHWNQTDNDNEEIDLDEDVLEEERRLDHSIASDYQVRVKNLRKVYYDRGIKKVAVKELSFGVQYGECFSLLGVNGAGKTTTFKALTGEVTPSRGKVHINGYNVLDRSELSKARKFIGYCPQFDALFNGLTVREHLEFYSCIKGILPEYRKDIIQRKMEQMDLIEYENKDAAYLSGGNKRKLSVAMAMIGNPPIVLLDEPSTGMDPKSKRFMWSVISNITTLKKKSAVVLTTHSMEEAEALSTKVGIMANGYFKCYGTVQHLKSKFGNYYEIEFRMNHPSREEINQILSSSRYEDTFKVSEYNIDDVLREADFMEIRDEFSLNGLGSEITRNELSTVGLKIYDFIEWCIIIKNSLIIVNDLKRLYGSVDIIEHFGNAFKIKVPSYNLSVGKIFEHFEEEFRQLISDYSVTQATLEQITINKYRE